MPPGLHRRPARASATAPRRAIAAAARATSGGPSRPAPSCPALSQIGTTQRRRRPRRPTPSTRSARCTCAGPFKGAPLSLVAITPALAGPYDYGIVVVRVALHVDPLTAQVSAASDTVPSIIGGVPIRMRSIQVNIDKPNFTINPTNCSPLLGRLARGSATRARSPTSPPTSTRSTARTLPFKPKMTVRQVGRKGTKRATQPPDAVRPDDPPRRRQHQIALGDALERLRDRPAPPRQHLLGERADRKTVRRPHADRQGDDDDARCSTSRSPARSTRSPARAACRKLAFILNGQVNLVPRAETKTITKGGAGQLQTTVPVVPDAPIGHFRLTVFGGKTGYLVNTRDLCAERSGHQGRLHRPERQDPLGIGQGQGRLRQEVQARQAPPRAEPARLGASPTLAVHRRSQTAPGPGKMRG